MKIDMTYKEEMESKLKLLTNLETNEKKALLFNNVDAQVIDLLSIKAVDYDLFLEMYKEGNLKIDDFKMNDFNKKDLKEIVRNYVYIKENIINPKMEKHARRYLFDTLQILRLNGIFKSVNFYNLKNFDNINILCEKINLFQMLIENNSDEIDYFKRNLLSQTIIELKRLYTIIKEDSDIISTIALEYNGDVHFIDNDIVTRLNLLDNQEYEMSIKDISNFCEIPYSLSNVSDEQLDNIVTNTMNILINNSVKTKNKS